MHKPLQGRQILITRPVQQAQSLVVQLETLGAKVYLLPTIEIADVEDPASVQADIKQLADFAMAIFVSPNAVKKVVPLIRHVWPKWPTQVQIAAIGASTARAIYAEQLSVDVSPSEQFNSESLLALSALQKVAGKKIIIFCAAGGRDLLASALRERGAQVTESYVYRRLLPAATNIADLPIGQSDSIDIIVCTSNSGLRNLVTLIGQGNRQWLINMPLLVISPRMMALAKTLGFVKRPQVADNATDEAIVTALLQALNK